MSDRTKPTIAIANAKANTDHEMRRAAGTFGSITTAMSRILVPYWRERKSAHRTLRCVLATCRRSNQHTPGRPLPPVPCTLRERGHVLELRPPDPDVEAA